MSENAKVLLNALGAYDSDSEASSSSKSDSSYSETVPPETPAQPTDSNADMLDQEEKKDSTLTDKAPYDGIDDDDLKAYAQTKQKLEALLGCDKVSDFVSSPNMPPCSMELEAKFKHWYELKGQGANFNETLMRNKTFRNPNIYRWLVDHLQLDEAGTNFDQFDPTQLRNDFTAKSLGDEQEKRARDYAARKAAGTQRNIQFYSGGYEKLVPANQQHSRSNTHTDSGRSFEEAVARAKLIAQHLSRPKQQ
ncbi:hypothetical protein IWW36_000374 [Coemansia brasiliensis]|uniref:Uncharacterized protein n=1 Tax=Coemansia brasiliensis TaxID=2650707 RepID=A0A9W8IJL8_9FUNG|nr:hypothetical protein IWW36_000374 [Coemansia brasiliensis]